MRSFGPVRRDQGAVHAGGEGDGGVEPHPTVASKVAKGDAGLWQRRFGGAERPENGPVDRFQRRMRKAAVAKPTTIGMSAIRQHMSGIVGGVSGPQATVQ